VRLIKLVAGCAGVGVGVATAVAALAIGPGEYGVGAYGPNGKVGEAVVWPEMTDSSTGILACGDVLFYANTYGMTKLANWRSQGHDLYVIRGTASGDSMVCVVTAP